MKQPQNAKDKHEIPSSIERELWIEESAYFLAESRGFIPGFDQEDWEMAAKHYDNIFPNISHGTGDQKLLNYLKSRIPIIWLIPVYQSNITQVSI